MRPGAAAAVVLAGVSLGGWAGCPRQAPVQSPPAAGQPGGEQAVKQGEEERPRVKLGEPADEKAARERAAERARAHLAKVLDVPSEQIAVASAKLMRRKSLYYNSLMTVLRRRPERGAPPPRYPQRLQPGTVQFISDSFHPQCAILET
ncbi:MAG: hypothetical protein H6Q10_2422 [Acidobacteria bacterium]|nr:hypothetical protein [Acidobacteriota bacterium]